MKTKILASLIVMTLLVGVAVGAGAGSLLNGTPKDETLTTSLSRDVKTTLKTQLTDVYWQKDLITEGNAVSGYLCIQERGKELQCNHLGIVSNLDGERGSLTAEDYVKQRQTEIASVYLQRIYDRYVADTTPQVPVDFGKKTVSLE